MDIPELLVRVSRFKRLIPAAWMACLLLLGLTWGAQAQAKNVLLLTTTEDPVLRPDGVAIVNNCIADFQYWKSLDPVNNQLTVMAGKLNSTASPLTMTDLFPAPPATAPYDVIATCNVYAQSLPSAASIMNQAMQTRVARTFLLFDEPASFQEGWINAISDWQVTKATYRAGAAVSQVANTASPYVLGSAFQTNLPTMGGHSYAVYKGVPSDLVLYSPTTVTPSGTYPVTEKASTLVVPLSRSYPDGNGFAQGACVIVSTDVSMFDSVRWVPSNANYRRISRTFLAATDPGGPCGTTPTITKSFDRALVQPGDTATLTIRLQNNNGFTDAQGNPQPGADVTGVNLTDNLPAPLILAAAPSMTCSAGTLVGAVGGNQLGIQNGTIQSASCTVTAQVQWPNTAAGQSACPVSAPGSITNRIGYGTDFTASAGPTSGTKPSGGNWPEPFNAVAQLACQQTPFAELEVTKTADKSTSYKGDTVVFTVTITNSGDAPATGVSVSDPMTADWTSAAWTCSRSDGVPCPTAGGNGNITHSNLTVPANGSVTYTITSVASGTNQSAVNTVAVTPTAPTLCSNGKTSCSDTARVTIVGVVSLTKTFVSQSATPLLPGGSIVYDVVLTNDSTTVPVQHGILVSDPLPNGISSGTWTCSGENNCYGLTGGSLPLNVTVPGLLAFVANSTGRMTFRITATVDPQNRQYTPIVNTATATPTAPDLCVGGKTSCSASVSTPVTLPGSVQITKTLTSAAVVQRGGTATYEIEVSNPSTTNAVANKVVVADPVPAGASAVTFACTSGCNLLDAADATGHTIANLPAQAKVKYLVTLTVAANAAHGATIQNVATATPSGADVCTAGVSPCTANAAVVTVFVPGTVEITKRLLTSATALRGDPVTYEIVVTNPSDGPVNGAINVADTLPSGLDAGTWSCTGACSAVTGGNTALADQLPSLAAGASATYTISTQISATAAHGLTIENSATATPTAPELCVGGAASCTAKAGPITVTVPGAAQIGKQLTSSATAKPGDEVTYQVIVSNSAQGPLTKPIAVADPLPVGMASGKWVCSGACGTLTIGDMPLNEQLPSLAVGATATFSITTKVGSRTANDTTIVNTATITPTSPEVCGTGQTSCSANAPAVTVQVQRTEAQPVPSLSQWALMLLSALMALAYVARQQRKR